MFTIIIDTFFRKMKLYRESLDFKYVSDEMSNLSLAQEYPTVFKIKGTLSCLLYIFAQILSCKIILHVFVICSYFFKNYPSFDAISFRDSISVKMFEFSSGPFCWA